MNETLISTDTPAASVTLDVTTTKDGKLYCRLFNERIDVVSRLAKFGIAYTKACRNVLQIASLLHDKCRPLRQKNENIDDCVELYTTKRDINDPNSATKEVELTYRIQDKKTKVVLEIYYDENTKTKIKVTCYRVAHPGDACVDGQWKTVFREEEINIKKNLEKTIDELYEDFLLHCTEEDVEKVVDSIALSDI